MLISNLTHTTLNNLLYNIKKIDKNGEFELLLNFSLYKQSLCEFYDLFSLRQDAQSIEDYIAECENKLYDTFEHNAEKYEQLLEEFTTRLHQNHYLGLKKMFLTLGKKLSESNFLRQRIIKYVYYFIIQIRMYA